ncbi:malto-oligosyltrehalose trehalohydrolase [Rhizobium sp. HT1-10]|uniref:malto-oligosyltrehalose trehalohydrolase n=1 Tax=Rhizobium sp. HT1-10 TaxID=3111638 RepID=UPI003C170464
MSLAHFGPVFTASGILFRLWAPRQRVVSLKIDGGQPISMAAGVDGWFSANVDGAGAGTAYKFVLEDGMEVPDPASRFQPAGPHGDSEVIDPETYQWQAREWSGRRWEEAVVYELHVGTFTPEGTFRALIDRLDHLVALGVTVLQLMPVNDFPGERGWGYDGVLPYAPHTSYGRPEDLKALVDAAHQRGLCIFLDVIYNHFGPDGNYLPLYAPLFTDKHKSPWGQGINYDGEDSQFVREFVIQNALHWLQEYRVDGLRFDAVHAIVDDSREHLLKEMARRIRSEISGRHIHLIVENEENNSALLFRNNYGKPELYTAQWNDDMHHVLHVAATSEDFGYYADFADDTAKIGRGLAEGFVYQGEHMPYRGAERGQPSGGLPPTAFIAFIQNHDQIGNRAFGDRLNETASAEAIRAMAAIYLLSPQIPMLFMGEEWDARQPFPYFCDFNEELNAIVRKGRREELSRLPGFGDGDSAANAPDPTKRETFLSAKLDWQDATSGEGAERLAYYRNLLAIRHKEIIPRLENIGGNSGAYRVEGKSIDVRWALGDGTSLRLLANVGADDIQGAAAPEGRIIWSEGGLTDGKLSPWSVIWSIA